MAADKTTITIERIGKFGVMSGGVWFNLSSKSGLKISDFSPMTSYDVLVYTSDSGKKYINQIVGNGAVIKADYKKVEEKVFAEASKPGDDKLLEILKRENPIRLKVDTHNIPTYEKKEVDWDKKNAQIRAQGTVQAAVQSQALSMFAANYDEWLSLVIKTAEAQLKFIEEHS
jgi:hypothetical protein